MMGEFQIKLKLGGIPAEFTGLGLIFFSDKDILRKRLMPGSIIRVVIPENMFTSENFNPRKRENGESFFANGLKTWLFRVGLPGIIRDLKDDEACVDEYNSKQSVLDCVKCFIVEKSEVKNVDRIVYLNLIGDALSYEDIIRARRAGALRQMIFNPGFIARIGEFTILPIDIPAIEVNSCGFCDDTNTSFTSYESYFLEGIQDLQDKISNKDNEIQKLELQINAINGDADIKEMTAEIDSKNGVIEDLKKRISNKTEMLNDLISKHTEKQLIKNNIKIKDPTKGPPPVDF